MQIIATACFIFCVYLINKKRILLKTIDQANKTNEHLISILEKQNQILKEILNSQTKQPIL